MSQEQERKKLRVWPLVLTFVLSGSVLVGAYFGVKNFLDDRQAILSHKPVPPRPILDRVETRDGKQVKTYTAKELEELRKKGQLPPGVAQPYVPNQANMANEAAVQRSLRTIEEINKINRMNQQLAEQQQRMQRQK